jgi:hypothetical protein
VNNVCYYSDQNALSPHLIYRNVRIKINRTIVLPWPLMVRNFVREIYWRCLEYLSRRGMKWKVISETYTNTRVRSKLTRARRLELDYRSAKHGVPSWWTLRLLAGSIVWGKLYWVLCNHLCFLCYNHSETVTAGSTTAQYCPYHKKFIFIA